MRRDEVVQRLREHADAIKAIGARSLYLYGSTARGDAAPTSDVDLFVDYDEESDFSAIELIRIKHYAAIFSAPRPTSPPGPGCTR